MEEFERRDASQGNFIDFVKTVWPGFIEGRHHQIMGEAFNDIASGKLKRLIVNMPPRHQLEVATPIPTTTGWKTMGSIQVGDHVFTPSGQPVLVTGKSPVTRQRLYRVTTSDGASVLCDGDHLWSLRFGSRHVPFRTISTRDALLKIEGESWGRHNSPMLPRHAPVQYPERDLPIDPYVLGAWLGDGASASGAMAAHPDDAPHIRARFEAAGVPTTTLSRGVTFGTQGLHARLRELGALNNKHIPEAYLTASVDQRLALMQGLMDTDGCVTKDGKCTFHTSVRHLAEQFLQLVHSFGLKGRITTRQTHYNGKPSKPSFRIQFKMANAASLPRKAKHCRDSNGNWSRSIKIELTDQYGDVQCLQVANSDGLFMAGYGYIVTHNTKSEFASYLLPAWYLGKHPHKKIIMASHTAELAVGFGRKVRNLVDEARYKGVFPAVSLQADNKAAGRWNTSVGGEYFAIGVGGAVTGKGADLLIIDDPHSEQDAMVGVYSQDVYDRAWEWFVTGPRQRLQPGAAMVIVMTRWSKVDITGRLLAQAAKNGELNEWRVIQFPAILPSGNPLWPEFWSLKELEKVRKDIPTARWLAQYQQDPTSDEGAIIKREWWQKWTRSRAPECTAVITSWDTAYTKNNRSDYSACTTWGTFTHPDTNKPAIILLDAFRDKYEFPQLKLKAKQHCTFWQPDMMIVEGKAAGQPLIYELRAMGLPVHEFVPVAGQDKVLRANAVSDFFSSGMVYAPDTTWANDVIEECAEFPNGEHDDFVDTVTQAFLRLRKGGLVNTERDDWSEDVPRVVYSEGYY